MDLPTQTWAQARPDAEAVFDVGSWRRWSWAELHVHTTAWAERLRQHDVEAGDRLAVLAPNHGETIVLLMAAAQIGATLALLNGDAPPALLREHVDDCAPKVMLADRSLGSLAGQIIPLETPLLSFGHGPGDDAVPPPARTGPHPGAHSAPWTLFYPPGHPHGLPVTDPIASALTQTLSASSRALVTIPLWTVVGLHALLTPTLLAGGRAVLMPVFDAGATLRLIEKEGITHILGDARVYQALASHAAFSGTDWSGLQVAAVIDDEAVPALSARYQARGLSLLTIPGR